MIKRLLRRIESKTNLTRRRRDRETVLLAYLEKNQSLTLDREGLDKIDMNRKQAFQAVYDLVLHETIQMRAEPDGRVVVMTNEEFVRQMETRAKETWNTEAKLILGGNQGAFDLAFSEHRADVKDCAVGQRQTMPDRRRNAWIALENYPVEAD